MKIVKRHGWLFLSIFSFLTIQTLAQTPPPFPDRGITYDLKQTLMQGPVTVRFSDSSEHSGLIFRFYQTGIFNSGKYKDWKFVVASVIDDESCKGPACDRLGFYRFANRNQKWVYFPNISSAGNHVSKTILDGFYPATHQTVEVDSLFSIPGYEYPQTLVGPSPGQILKYFEEGKCDCMADPSVLVPVFIDTKLGKVFTTKLSVSLSKVIYYQPFQKAKTDEPGDVNRCKGRDFASKPMAFMSSDPTEPIWFTNMFPILSRINSFPMNSAAPHSKGSFGMMGVKWKVTTITRPIRVVKTGNSQILKASYRKLFQERI